MIQISNPILTPDIPAETHPEKVAAEGIYGAEEKKKPGLFSKLLEGLLAKNTANAELSENADIGSVLEPAATRSQSLEDRGIEDTRFPSLIKTVSTDKDLGNIVDTKNQKLSTGPEEIPDAFAFIEKDVQAEQNFVIQSSFTDPGIAEKNETFLANFMETDREHVSDQVKQPEIQLEKPESKHLIMETPGQLNDELTGHIAGNTPRLKNAGAEEVDILNVSFKDFNSKYFAKTVTDDTKDAASGTDIRLSDSRDRKGRMNFQVIDLRTEHIQTSSKDAAGIEVVKSANAEIEIPVFLRNSEASTAKQTGSQGSTLSANLEEALAREIRGNLSTDIVRDATFIIRNGGEGTIRLSLHPASLGDVKIKLEMSENKIMGQIIVQTNEAFRAFEREISVLEQAFKDAGYSETSLEMSLAQDQWNFGADQEAALANEQRRENVLLHQNQMLSSSQYETEASSLGFSASTERKAVNLLI